jgi:hypothetical protein
MFPRPFDDELIHGGQSTVKRAAKTRWAGKEDIGMINAEIETTANKQRKQGAA